jgi:succinoglycan biosynthesis protein ExoL
VVQRRIRAEDAAKHVFKDMDATIDTCASPDLVVAPAARQRLAAYFGPDVDDPVARRRVAQWRYAGFGVLALAFSRNTQVRHGQEEFISLGRVMPLSRVRRVLPLALAAIRLVARRKVLAGVDLFIARNLDIALLAIFARWAAASSAPVVYEVLDVNPSCTEGGWQGALLRWLERWVLARANLLVVSSPYFGTDYYEAILHYRRPWFLLENKIPRWVSSEQRPQAAIRGAAPRQAHATAKGPWRIGWFGYLDDQKSWDILRSIARELPQEVAIHLRGRPYTNFDMTRFLADVEQLGNVSYGGPYRNPEDLAEVYGAVDIVWSIDCNFPTANSKWLLTNGLYEAGCFGKPALGLLGTAVGEFLATHGSGWCLSEPLAENPLEFVRNLTAEEYEAKRRLVAGLSRDLFVETDEIPRLWTLLQSKETLEGVFDATSPAALSQHEL